MKYLAKLFIILALSALSFSFAPSTSFSQNNSAQPSRVQSTCLAMANNNHGPWQSTPLIQKASFSKSASSDFQIAKTNFPEVKIEYLNHSTFRITSPEGLKIETDFAQLLDPTQIPDVVTMNHAHGSHYTDFVPESIEIILRGWAKNSTQPAKHHLSVQDVLIRNVPTDIYRGGILREANGNSIFIFETAGLCIGHLGHIHHQLSPELIAKIGRLDVLMIPVDGGRTLTSQSVLELSKNLRSSVILPMHWFSNYGLSEFIGTMAPSFQISAYPVESLNLSLNTLPKSPTVVIMSPVNDIPRGDIE